ncbi:MAG TPA: TrmH family RNA methyltransferase [Candidatus Saccharimonadia bacterium]|nr:TrmH family RNA methyltransferase [Candidatus Saccharimonadia bacterium]
MTKVTTPAVRPMPCLAIILADVRSAQNVGAILRTADAVGAELVITCGITPHPQQPNDPRPGHVAASNHRAIAKTALGAELTVPQQHFATLEAAIKHMRHHHYSIAALEQAENSQPLFDFTTPSQLALVVGPEVAGLALADLALCDTILELPMLGRKESLNVSVAAGIALYRLRFG